MRLKKINNVIAILLIVSSLTGCASVWSLNELRKIKNDTFYLENEKDFDENKLIYNKNIRAFEYDGKFLFKETGEKIRYKEDAIKALNCIFEDEFFTTKDKIIIGVSLVYAIPVFFYTITAQIVLWVTDIPLYPTMYYFINKYPRLSFSNYKNGMELFEKKEFEKARNQFMKSIVLTTSIIQDSDIYYQIAKTYEMEGNKEAELKYYNLFLNYSVRQYPEFFTDEDESYANDFEKLNLLFTEAEEKINDKSANF